MDFTHLSATLGTDILLGSLTPRATSAEIEYLACYIRLPTTPPRSPSGSPSRSPYGDEDPDDDVPDYTPESPDYTPVLMASPMADPDDYFPLPDPSLNPSQLPSLVVQLDDTLAIEEEDPAEIEFYEDGESERFPT
ncbi:hypothetical protein GUJ93_ZPchr0010g9582 [Zizania palustris]|uniref:Uncharacterized protein n=1 Tax=Zizania palustris TaxID=103762 RepID=A0A8J5TDQ2_ZIZPA|nr:hypothetical protein GUJ93_ZPchr0010g9582 [Zizania palustris]